jgi:ATP-dependent Clp protease protease subunit
MNKKQGIGELEVNEEILAKITNSDYFINDSIHSGSVHDIISGIIEANADIAAVTLTEGEFLYPIRIFINSEGGSLSDAFSLISVMKSSVIPIITIALGDCSSSALMIAMAGDVRYVSKYCSILSHQYSMSMGMAKYVDIKSRIKDNDLTANRIVDLYTECTGLSADVVNEHLLKAHDVFLTAEEALTYNLFDEYFENFGQIVPIIQSTTQEETDEDL